jgi:acetoin:2,6-dichlorophenolindophenol oxidoreductase subunit alpha
MAIYAAMLKCRAIEQRAATLLQRGRIMRDFHASAGREAAAAAFVIDLKPEDVLCLPDDDAIPTFTKGASLKQAFRALSTDGSGKSRWGSDLTGLNIIPATTPTVQLLEIRKEALAFKQANRSEIILTFLTALTPRAKWESLLTTAAAQNLPFIFVVQGKAKKETDGGGQAMLKGVPVIAVDGSDAVAIYRVASEAITRARQGRGPTLVECTPVQDIGATGKPADRIHIQSKGPVLTDPILSMENYLRRKGLWSEESHRRVVADIEQELDLATKSLNQ